MTLSSRQIQYYKAKGAEVTLICTGGSLTATDCQHTHFISASRWHYTGQLFEQCCQATLLARCHLGTLQLISGNRFFWSEELTSAASTFWVVTPIWKLGVNYHCCTATLLKRLPRVLPPLEPVRGGPLQKTCAFLFARTIQDIIQL